MVFIAWRDGKPFIAGARAVQSVVQVLCNVWGERLIYYRRGRAWGLTGALGMRQARPCYWSQTQTSIEKFSTS